MNRKTAIVLMVALLCGLGAMVASSKFLAPAPSAGPEMQEILVASRDLDVEEVLKPELLKTAQVPKSTAPAGSFAAVKDVEERWVQIKVLEGEPILDRKLAPKGTPTGLIARIPKGKRAFAITVNEQSGVSGFILPDHHVDVIQIKPGTNNSEAETILEDVLVLASGTTFQSSTDRSIQAKTVTVAVTVEEAAVLTAAQSGGNQLSMALRGLNDHARNGPIGPPRSLMLAKAPPPPEPKPEPKAPEPVVEEEVSEPEPPVVERRVVIYRGGRTPEVVRVDPIAQGGPR